MLSIPVFQSHGTVVDKVEGIEEWYRINVAIPFLDHIVSELNTQFSNCFKIIWNNSSNFVFK